MSSDQQSQQYQQQQQQQWMMMQSSQQQPVPPPAGWTSQAVPQVQTQQYLAPQTSGSEEVRSLWIGDLLPWMEENYLLTCFSQTGEVKRCVCIYKYVAGCVCGHIRVRIRRFSSDPELCLSWWKICAI